MEAFVDEVGRDFYFATEAEVKVVATLYTVEVYPKLWFGHEYILSALPWARFAAKVEVAIERAPAFGKVYAPYTCELEVVGLLSSAEAFGARYGFIHGGH